MDNTDHSSTAAHSQKGDTASSGTIRLAIGAAGDCPYLDGQQARYAILQQADKARIPYAILVENGFRRDGNYIFRPTCESCQACQSLKVDVAAFRYSRRYRRNLANNQDLTIETASLEILPKYFSLFSRYQEWRHPEQHHMLNEDSLKHFQDDDIDSFALIARHQGTPIAVSIVDQLSTGLSAVYTFYEPDEFKRGLGTHMILQMIRYCEERALPWLYLGYYVQDCQKLRYKEEFRPALVFSHLAQGWVRLA